MINFFQEYGIFFAKTLTFVIAFLLIIAISAAILAKNKIKEKLVIKNINKKFEDYKNTINQEILSKKECKKLFKKAQKTKKNSKNKKRVFVLNFLGDIKASALLNLREEITALLKVATEKDEVVALIESGGGYIHSYGLGASQLLRIRDHNIPLTVVIDKVAASGGYLMACVANQIMAAPFAIVGSIGVISQLPNFNKFLKKHNIDFEQITAGQYKRTLSLFGENTEQGRQKMQEEVEEAHKLFKNFVEKFRPSIDINKMATGENWYGTDALSLGLIDKITTSDDYLLNLSDVADIYEIKYTIIQKRFDKFTKSVQSTIENLIY